MKLSLVPLRHVDEMLLWCKPQLQVTVFAIMVAWTAGFVMPAVFLM